MNKVFLKGRLGRDPETRYSEGGNAVTTISVATSEKWKDKATGEVKEETQWHRVTYFGRTAEIVTEHFKKGDEIVCTDGKIQYNSWEVEGVKKYATSIIMRSFEFCGGRPGGGGGHSEQAGQQEVSMADQLNDDFDDDIPF